MFRFFIVNFLLAIFVIAPAQAQEGIGVWTWDAPTEGSPVVGYEVSGKLDTENWVVLGTVENSEFSWEGMHMGTMYFLKVKAFDADGDFGESSPEGYWFNDGIPGTPSGPTCRWKILK